MAGVFNKEYVHQIPTIGLIHIAGSQSSLFVHYVASIMFNDFRLSINGQRHIASCLSNLPYVETPDDRLSFGWGPDNVMRDAVIHQHGYEHLAVCVALASTFHEAYAAEVCHAYACLMAHESDVLPHLSQWKAQIKSECGVFTAAPFAQLVEDYIRLDPYSVGPGSNLIARRCRVNPTAMAKGLMALSTVTSKNQNQITLVGGAVIGWFAALSEFFYDLNVAILSRTGEKLHGDPNNESTQVILVYHEDPDLEVTTEHWSTIQETSNDDNPFWSRHVHILPFGGRVLWLSLLPQVFGRAFWTLEHEESKTLADLIGGAARGLEGDYEHHRAEGGESFLNSPANASSYGLGLIQNLTGWLPELRKGQGRMERQLKRTPEDGAAHYEEQITRLQNLCNCTICTTSNSTSPPKNGYCLPVISETIVALGLAISRMTVAAGIYPTREGVQGIYASQALKRTEAKNLNMKDPADRVQHYKIIYSNEWNASDSRRLQNAVELFSGVRPETDVPDSLVAVAHEGICAYVTRLRRSDQAPVREGEKGFIEVTSGAINLRQKLFTRVSTEPVDVGESREALPWEEVRLRHWKRAVWCK